VSSRAVARALDDSRRYPHRLLGAVVARLLRADDEVTEATGPHTRLMSMAFAFVTAWLLVWGAVAGAGTFSYLRPS